MTDLVLSCLEGSRPPGCYNLQGALKLITEQFQEEKMLCAQGTSQLKPTAHSNLYVLSCKASIQASVDLVSPRCLIHLCCMAARPIQTDTFSFSHLFHPSGKTR